MASSATPAPGTRTRTPRSMFVDLRTGRKPVAGFRLALVPLLVLLVMRWVNVARLSDNRDQIDDTDRVLRGLDIVLADLTAETGQRGLLITGQDDYLAPFIAGQKAVAGDIETVSTLTAGNPLQQQRIGQLRPQVQQNFIEVQATVGLRRSQGFQAVRAVALQNKANSVMDQIRSLTGAVQAEEESPLGVRQADSAFATQATRSSPIVAGRVGSLVVASAASGIGRSITGPLHRAVAVLQGLAEGRLDQRRRPTTRDEVGDMSRALDAALYGPTGSATRAGVVSAAPESADVQTVAAGTEETGPSIREIATDAAQASEVAAQAVSAVETTTATVTRLGDSSTDIGNVVKVTTSTAQQTNLPALNARAAEDIARRVQAIPADTGAAVAAIGEISEVVAQISDRQTPVTASLVGVRGVPGAVAFGARAADLRTGTAASTLAVTSGRATLYAAARSRAHGPTTALWHAVALHRPVGEVDAPCELTVCGSLVRVSTEQRWPLAARDVCPACATLAH